MLAATGVAALLASNLALGQERRPFRHDTGWASNDGTQEEIVHSFTVHAGGAPWLRVLFDEVHLAGDPSAGTASILRITSWLDGHVQTMNAKHVAEWRDASAYFNGDRVQVEVVAQPGTGPNRIVVGAVVAGLPIVEQPSLCGGADDRTLSYDARVARLIASGTSSSCTGWIIDGCGHCMLSVGHCFNPASPPVMDEPPGSSTALPRRSVDPPRPTPCRSTPRTRPCST
ncbi:MAG: hypothetical protein GY711_17265 [bacterium]|nr:hypothetical protein [bacterium]